MFLSIFGNYIVVNFTELINVYQDELLFYALAFFYLNIETGLISLHLQVLSNTFQNPLMVFDRV